MQTTTTTHLPRRNGTSSMLALNMDRVRAEFNEMPGLCLTLPQAVRFWALDPESCRGVLDQLTREGFLVRGRHGYRRAH